MGVYVRFEKSTFNIILEFLFIWKYCCFHTTHHRMQGSNLLVGCVRESLMAEGMRFGERGHRLGKTEKIDLQNVILEKHTWNARDWQDGEFWGVENFFFLGLGAAYSDVFTLWKPTGPCPYDWCALLYVCHTSVKSVKKNKWYILRTHLVWDGTRPKDVSSQFSMEGRVLCKSYITFIFPGWFRFLYIKTEHSPKPPSPLSWTTF